MIRRSLLVLAAAAVLAACGDGSGPSRPRPPVAVRRADDPRPLRVLFVGNSLTFYNDLPQRTAEMAVRDTALRAPDLKTVVRPGYSLRQHWFLGEARDSLLASRWDYLVLQEGSGGLLQTPETTAAYVARFDSVARARGVRTVLYLTWTYGELPLATQDTVTAAAEAVAGRVDALVAPAGVAWQRSRQQRPDLTLYLPDSIHPAPLGTWLAAAVFTGTLWRRTPVGLAGTVAVGDTSVVFLDSATVLQLASVAWAATLPYLPGPIPLDAPRAAVLADDGPPAPRPRLVRRP